MNVLLIDDDTDIHLIIKATLEAEGYRVKCVRDEREILLALQQFNPELVLVDYMLEENTGPDLIVKMRDEFGKFTNTPIILLSGKSRDIDENYLISMKIAGKIEKPFDPLKLSDLIKTILDKSERNV